MTQTKFKYQLSKSSKKLRCPKCGKKTFVPYVLSSDMKTFANAELYGRCDRERNCAYIKYPKGNNLISDWIAPEPQPYTPPTPDFIPEELVESSFGKWETNVFFMWLIKMFGKEEAFELQKKYNIGTAKGNGTIFWQKDYQGKFRTGKVMYYNRDGRRNKNRNSWYVHNQVKRDYSLVQVFFGEHLVKEDKPVALCESEKTSILMSVIEPHYNWLASGGANMLNSYRLLRLPRLDFVSPDEGEFEKWRQATNIFNNREMDTRVEHAVRDGIIEKGADILDLMLLQEKVKCYD